MGGGYELTALHHDDVHISALMHVTLNERVYLGAVVHIAGATFPFFWLVFRQLGPNGVPSQIGHDGRTLARFFQTREGPTPDLRAPARAKADRGTTGRPRPARRAGPPQCVLCTAIVHPPCYAFERPRVAFPGPP